MGSSGGSKLTSMQTTVDDMRVAECQTAVRSSKSGSAKSQAKTIWIDLDNSPHVPFFAPIVRQLEQRGYRVVLTARDAFQVTGLLDLLGLSAQTIGRHYGKSTAVKLAAICIRAAHLLPVAIRTKPDLAVSHGSRSQLLASAILRIPYIHIGDYEFARIAWGIKPQWVIAPEVIPDSALPASPDRIMKYPGLKEDVYVGNFVPVPGIRKRLGVAETDLLVTIRPPATEAHYFRPESESLFIAVVDYLAQQGGVRMVILPRNNSQESRIREQWGGLVASGKLIIPLEVLDGVNLAWHSDLVVSGGGTMNREAAALGIPVYSTFRGEIGAVDRYLSDTGRLILLENAEDILAKLRLVRWQRPAFPDAHQRGALAAIVEHIVAVAEQTA